MTYLPIFCLCLAALGGLFWALATREDASELGAVMKEFAYVCLFAALLLVVLASFIGCAPSRMGKALNVGVVASAAADLVTTRDAINSGRGYEANPFMGQSAWQQGLVKLAGTSAVIGAASLIELKGHRTVAHVMRIAFIAVNTAVAIHNHGVGR